MTRQPSAAEAQSQQHVRNVIAGLGLEIEAMMKEDPSAASDNAESDIPLGKKKKKNKQGVEAGHNEIKVNAGTPKSRASENKQSEQVTKKNSPATSSQAEGQTQQPSGTQGKSERNNAAKQQRQAENPPGRANAAPKPANPSGMNSVSNQEMPVNGENFASNESFAEEGTKSQDEIRLSAALENLRRTTMATRDTLSDTRYTDIGSGDLSKAGPKVGREVSEEEAMRIASNPRATVIIRTRTIQKALSEQQSSAAPAQTSPYAAPVGNTSAKPAYLVLIETGEIIDINPHGFKIGKDDTCECIIDEHYVSRKHALISVVNGEYYIEDLGSTNGTFVNRVKVEGSTKKKLDSGDTIKLADIKLRFVEK